MNKTVLSIAATMAIYIVVTPGYSAAAAATRSGSDTQPLPPLTHAVRFNDLDLSRMEDVSALYGRLVHAARAVCEPFKRPGIVVSAKGAAEAAACVDRTVDAAVTRVNRPLLTQYHNSRNARRAQLAQMR